jgi:hypothetical protein
MKPFLYLFILLLLSDNSKSQDSTVALSQFELFATQAGRFCKTEYKEIGSLGWLNPVYLFKVSDIKSGSNAYAIRLGNINSRDMPALVNPLSIYIDLIDLDSVINVLEQFKQEAGKHDHPADLHLFFITQGDLSFGATYDKSDNSWQFFMARVYKNLRTNVPYTFARFNKKRFMEFLEILKVAKSSTW